MTDSYTRTTCRLCDSLMIRPVLDLGETPLANELDGTELFPLVVMRCDDCEHHQLSIAVAPERLWGPSYPYQSGTSPVFRAHLEKLADEVAALKPGGSVLEIASNDGTLVDMLYMRHMRPCGIDPSATGNPGGVVVRGSWPHPDVALIAGGDFDVILALNVFAHVDDLHSFTAAVKEALAPDGVFILEVGYLPTVIERGLFDVIYHEHLSYHSLSPLPAFFARHGLIIRSVARNESQGGSLRLYVGHDDGKGIQSIGRALDDEGKVIVGVDIAKLRERITLTEACLQLACPSSGEIAGYGCPAKLTTLMYAAGMSKWLDPIDYIFDDNPLKVGRTTPGMNIPIVPTSELLERNPDTLILFSWNFSSEIIPRLRAMGYRGRIVTPLPEVTVDEV